MTNSIEAKRWFKDAEDNFKRAKKCYSEKDWRGAIQNAQMAIELSGKSIIAFFEEPKWSNDPGDQLLEVIEEREKEIEEKFNSKMIESIRKINEDAEISEPWHGRSTYGKIDEEKGIWLSSVDVCTEEVAKDLIKRAERTFKITKIFIKKIK